MKQFDDISNQQSDDFVRQKISHHRFFYAECRFFLEFIASLSAIVSTSFDQIGLIQIKVSCGLLESWAVIYVCISKIGILCAKPHSFFCDRTLQITYTPINSVIGHDLNISSAFLTTSVSDWFFSFFTFTVFMHIKMCCACHYRKWKSGK